MNCWGQHVVLFDSQLYTTLTEWSYYRQTEMAS